MFSTNVLYPGIHSETCSLGTRGITESKEERSETARTHINRIREQHSDIMNIAHHLTGNPLASFRRQKIA